jgi:hypothetical protein
MTTPTDTPLWRRIYDELQGSRPYALTPLAERELETMWMACGQDRDLFIWAVKESSHRYGLDILRPPAKAKWEPPPPRKDAHGREMANPYLSPTRNREDQKAVELLDPEQAAHLKAMAEHPWSYQLQKDAEEQARQRWNKVVETYVDAENPLKKGDEARADFVRKCEEDGDPEKLEVFRGNWLR